MAGLASLQTLNLDDCSGLEALPELAGLASLQTLNLDDSSGLDGGAARAGGGVYVRTAWQDGKVATALGAVRRSEATAVWSGVV